MNNLMLDTRLYTFLVLCETMHYTRAVFEAALRRRSAILP